MKKYRIYLFAIAIFLLFFAGCIVNIGDSATVQTRLIASLQSADQPSLLKLISIALLSAYEVVVRLIPTIGDYSAVSWIINLLKRISDTLDNQPTG